MKKARKKQLESMLGKIDPKKVAASVCACGCSCSGRPVKS